jgi:hypothetical protein
MFDSAPEIQTLSDTLLYELTKALGLSQDGVLGKAIRPLFEKATRHFAELGIGFSETCTPEQARQAVKLSARRMLQSHLAWQV